MVFHLFVLNNSLKYLSKIEITYTKTSKRILKQRNLGILRYKVDFQSLQADELLDDVDLDDY